MGLGWVAGRGVVSRRWGCGAAGLGRGMAPDTGATDADGGATDEVGELRKDSFRSHREGLFQEEAGAREQRGAARGAGVGGWAGWGWGLPM